MLFYKNKKEELCFCTTTIDIQETPTFTIVYCTSTLSLNMIYLHLTTLTSRCLRVSKFRCFYTGVLRMDKNQKCKKYIAEQKTKSQHNTNVSINYFILFLENTDNTTATFSLLVSHPSLFLAKQPQPQHNVAKIAFQSG